MDIGIMLGDAPLTVEPRAHFDALRRHVEAAQRNGVSYILIGQHFLYPDYHWFQPVPLLARLAADVDANVRLVTSILIAPLYNPVLLAEELATLDVVTEGRLIVGLGLGYMAHEFEAFGVSLEERVARFEELVPLVKQLWTGDALACSGRFWRIPEGRTQVKPFQTPHPPLWIGAQTRAGVRRAARLGDAWSTTPRIELDELRELMEVYRIERLAQGLPLGRHPLRREIVIGDSRKSAVARYIELAGDRYRHQARQGSSHMDPGVVEEDLAAFVGRHAILGTAAECVDQLSAIARVLPVDPVVTRASWPGMDAEEVVDYLDTLGEELIPALREVRPVEILPTASP